VSLAALALAACVAAGPAPAVAILIDDIGYQIAADLSALGLPGAFSYAVLPHAPHSARFVAAARALRRDSLLHLPMEAEVRNGLLGPGALTHGMTKAAIVDTLDKALASVPAVVGISNHMGSRLTREQRPMDILAREVAGKPALFFVDSRTTARTVAAHVMRQRGVPTLERDVFLDNLRRPAAIRQQLATLIARAKRQGFALGIGHPYRETLAVLRAWRPVADQVRLVRISDLLTLPKAVVTPVQGATDCATLPRNGQVSREQAPS